MTNPTDPTLREKVDGDWRPKVEAVVPLRDYIETIFADHDRAVQVAEQEREKAARALRIELERAIAEGDRNLRDHIENQIQQIMAALVAADKLEIARIEAMAQLVEGVQREAKLVHLASEEAIAKADASNEKRFASMNEWRGQSADRERSQAQEMAKLSSQFMLREVADAQIDQLRQMISDLTEKVNKVV